MEILVEAVVGKLFLFPDSHHSLLKSSRKGAGLQTFDDDFRTFVSLLLVLPPGVTKSLQKLSS